MFLLNLKKKFFALLKKLGLLRGVYYIGSADTLPPPMTVQEENEILVHLEESPELRRVLVERNLRLVVYMEGI